MQHYKVQLQADDGQIEERDCYVRWDPEKVDAAFVAEAFAAERTVFSGKTLDGAFKRRYAGISAVLQEA